MYGKTKWIITLVQAIFFGCFFPGAGGVLFTNIVCVYDIVVLQYIVVYCYMCQCQPYIGSDSHREL